MRILHFFESYASAARALGVSGEAVRKWSRDGVPAGRVLYVCEVTNWAVSPNQLRPDIYPNQLDALPIVVPPRAVSNTEFQAITPLNNQEAA